MDRPVDVVVVAVSGGSCAGKPTWQTATAVLRRQLLHRFGELVTVVYVEFLSPDSFDFPAVINGIGDESLRLPVVLVNGKVLSSGAKLNEVMIAREISLAISAPQPGEDRLQASG